MLKWKFVAIISTTKINVLTFIICFFFFLFFFPVIVCFANVVVSCVNYMYHIYNVYSLVR